MDVDWLSIYLWGLIPAFVLFLLPAFVVSKDNYRSWEVVVNTVLWPVNVIWMPINWLYKGIDSLRS